MESPYEISMSVFLSFLSLMGLTPEVPATVARFSCPTCVAFDTVGLGGMIFGAFLAMLLSGIVATAVINLIHDDRGLGDGSGD